MKWMAFLLAMTTLIACGPSEQEQYEASMNVALDNGQVWKTDQSTIDGVIAMRRIMRDFRSASDKSLEAHQQLGNDLLVEFNTIFKMCTMEGPGHDELHNYLMPVRKQISTLKADNLAASKESVKALNKHFQAFESFFN